MYSCSFFLAVRWTAVQRICIVNMIFQVKPSCLLGILQIDAFRFLINHRLIRAMWSISFELMRLPAVSQSLSLYRSLELIDQIMHSLNKTLHEPLSNLNAIRRHMRLPSLQSVGICVCWPRAHIVHTHLIMHFDFNQNRLMEIQWITSMKIKQPTENKTKFNTELKKNASEWEKKNEIKSKTIKLFFHIEYKLRQRITQFFVRINY